MQDDPQSIDRLAARTEPPDQDPVTPAAGDVQVAAIGADPAAPPFEQAVAAAGLGDDLLATNLALLMQVPVWPEPVSGERAVLPAASVVAPTFGGDPQLLLSMLTGLSLAELMALSVESRIGLLEELDGAQAANPFAAEFLHNMLTLTLPDLMSVGPLQDLFTTDYADHPVDFGGPLNDESPEPAGVLPTAPESPTDHHAHIPVVGTEMPPPARPSLFTAGDNIVDFNTMSAGKFAGGNRYDALGGDDYIVLPSTPAAGAAASYDPAHTFTGGAGNDTIVAGGLADAIDGGAGIDTVSYAGSGAVIVLLQDVDTHGPHANEPGGGTGGLADGDSYGSIEELIGSLFGDYVFGGAGGGTVYLLDGNDVFDNVETQIVSDYVDGGAGSDTMWGGDGADTLLGGTGGDALNGERGADWLDGGDGADTLSGGDGDDLLDGGSGTDSLSGGNGNDILIWRDADTALSGGAGTDTLRVSSGNLNLTTLGGTASGLERIDLATDGGANGLTLSAADVVSLSDTDILTITGTSADSINAGTGWTDASVNGAGNHVFTKLSGIALATLVVNEDVTVNPDITS